MPDSQYEDEAPFYLDSRGISFLPAMRARKARRARLVRQAGFKSRLPRSPVLDSRDIGTGRDVIKDR